MLIKLRVCPILIGVLLVSHGSLLTQCPGTEIIRLIMSTNTCLTVLNQLHFISRLIILLTSRWLVLVREIVHSNTLISLVSIILRMSQALDRFCESKLAVISIHVHGLNLYFSVISILIGREKAVTEERNF